MKRISEKLKVIYLILLILFIAVSGILWIDYIGLIDISRVTGGFKSNVPLATEAPGDEPSLIEREQFEKEKQGYAERVEELDKREARLQEIEKELASEKEKQDEIKKGLDLEKKKFDDQKNRYAGYEKNIKVLADKVANMPPDESVKIMVNWEEPIIIDVLRQMDADAEALGSASITSYLITLMPKEKASRIMYLMTQL